MCIARVDRKKRRPALLHGGFTLLEITLAVAILATMALAIYRFVQATLTALRVSSEASAVDIRYNGLRDLLTAEWQSLPPGAGGVSGEPFKFSGRSRDEIRWTSAGGPGLLTRYATGDYSIWMRLQPESKKSDRLDLGFLRKTTSDSDLEQESWIPLIENVAGLQIRYFEPRLNVWVEKWADPARPPRLVKIMLERNDAGVPWEMIIPTARTPF